MVRAALSALKSLSQPEVWASSYIFKAYITPFSKSGNNDDDAMIDKKVTGDGV